MLDGTSEKYFAQVSTPTSINIEGETNYDYTFFISLDSDNGMYISTSVHLQIVVDCEKIEAEESEWDYSYSYKTEESMDCHLKLSNCAELAQDTSIVFEQATKPTQNPTEYPTNKPTFAPFSPPPTLRPTIRIYTSYELQKISHEFQKASISWMQTECHLNTLEAWEYLFKSPAKCKEFIEYAYVYAYFNLLSSNNPLISQFTNFHVVLALELPQGTLIYDKDMSAYGVIEEEYEEHFNHDDIKKQLMIWYKKDDNWETALKRITKIWRERFE